MAGRGAGLYCQGTAGLSGFAEGVADMFTRIAIVNRGEAAMRLIHAVLTALLTAGVVAAAILSFTNGSWGFSLEGRENE